MANFTQLNDLDLSTALCPCGSCYVLDGYSTNGFDAWKEKHLPHTDAGATTQLITDDGMRAFPESVSKEDAGRWLYRDG